jgi:OOP family OmpA-OmpF porin
LNRELPAGLSLDSASIDRPVVSPFTWSFELDKANAVVLAGYVPDTIVADRLSKAARTHAGSGQLHDSQHLASGAPEGFEAAALAALGAADRLTDMRASISDKTLAIEGETFTGIAANELRTKLSGELPPDFTLETRIVVRPPAEIIAPAECQADLGESLRQSSIRFETGSAGISTNSLGLLDRLAFTLRSCPEVRFEVGGHTDSEGTEEDNLDLSTARAQAVVDRLIRAGVRYSRLVAKGYGESRPVADNATQEGRARNRRIEFRIIQ